MALGPARDGFAVGDAGPVRNDLDAIACLHTLEHELEVQIGEAADDRFIEFLAVFDAEARVFLAKPHQRGRELLFLALVRRLDGKAEHRLGEFERLEVNLVLVVRIVQDRIEMDLVDLGHRGDVARHGGVDLNVVLAVDAEQMADLERLLAIVDEQLGVLAHRALVDAEDAELADERVVGDLEDVGDHVLGRIRHGRDRLGLGALALDERRRIAFERVRQQTLDEIEQGIDADPGARRDETDRHQMAFAQALFEGIMQFTAGQGLLALVEVAVHDLFVDFDDLVEDLLMGLGDAREIRLAIRLEEAVDHRIRAVRRQVDRQAFGAEFLAQFRSQRGEVAFGVDAIDDEDPSQAARFRVVHHAPGRVLDAVGGIDDDGAGFHGGQRGDGRSAEIRIARRVDQVDVAVAVVDRDQGGLDRVLAFLFHRVEVGNRRAALDRACRLYHAAGKQQGFDQGGFAGAGMACQGDVANAIGAV